MTRKIYLLALALLLAFSAMAFAGGGAEPAPDDTPDPVDAEAREAPMLAEMVAAGELPPLEERLPENPLVIEPVNELGQYGGTVSTWLRGGSDVVWLKKTSMFEHLVHWNPEGTGWVPNVAEGWEINEDATEYTFFLREGLKWSDGDEYTAADIMFWYEDVMLNEELDNGFPGWLTTGQDSTPVVISSSDPYTVTFTFADPHPFFLYRIAHPSGYRITNYPRHYLEQFHMDYNPENTRRAMEEGGFETWKELWDSKVGWIPQYQNVDLPRLHAWLPENAYTGEETYVRTRRNPYYFKVDTAGRQLPYVDGWDYVILEDPQVAALRLMNGDFDFASRHLMGTENRSVILDNRENGNYRAIPATGGGQAGSLYLNWTVQNDPVKREIFRNKDFRIGLSHAIDREEISSLLFGGTVEPAQHSVVKGDPLHNEQLYSQYTEFDVALANQYLDEAGYAERDADGMRLGPDGEPIIIEAILRNTMTQQIDLLELIEQYWEEVGIGLEVRPLETSLANQRTASSQYEMYVTPGSPTEGIWALMNPLSFLPYSSETYWAPAWGAWAAFTFVDEGAPVEEPDEAARRQIELYRQVLRTSNQPERQRELMAQILQIAADEFRVIGTTTAPTVFHWASNELQNLPETVIQGYSYPSPSPINPEQWYFR